MNIKELKSRCFCLALPIVFVPAFGGCASQQTPAQTEKAQAVKAQAVKAQPTTVQPRRIVLQKPTVRQVYKSAVAALTFSPDSKTLASVGGSTKKSFFPNTRGGLLKVEMLDISTLRTQKLLPPLPAASSVAFTPDLRKIVINPTLLDGLQLIDATNGKSLWRQYTQHRDWPPLPDGAPGLEHCNALSISRQGDKVVTAIQTPPTVSYGQWWSIGSKELQEGGDIENGEWGDIITCVAFAPDGQSFVAGGLNTTLGRYDTKSYKPIWLQDKYDTSKEGRGFQTITFSPDEKTIATGNADKSVSLWNAQNGQLLRTLKVHSKPVQVVVFSPDSTILASGSDDGAAVLSSTRNGATLHVSSSRKAVTALAFAPDGKHLAAGHADGKIALWRLR